MITAPTTTITGSWLGTITSAAAGEGTLAFTVTESSGTVSGNWSSSYVNPVYNNSGPVSGTESGQTVAMTLSSISPASCSYSLAGSLSGTNSITGTFAAFNCATDQTGVFAAQKQ
jgi:hypothetical protein